jgi:hypothetical protein
MDRKNKGILCFAAGILAGGLYAGFFYGQGKEMYDCLSMQHLLQLQYTEIVYRDYFSFLFRKRLLTVLVFLFAGISTSGKYLLAILFFVLGCSLGGIVTTLAMEYGGKGVALAFSLCIPQDFFYFPALFQIGRIMEQPKHGAWGTRGAGFGRKQKRLRLLWNGIVCIGVTIIGLLMECYVNPIAVKFCLKMF